MSRQHTNPKQSGKADRDDGSQDQEHSQDNQLHHHPYPPPQLHHNRHHQAHWYPTHQQPPFLYHQYHHYPHLDTSERMMAHHHQQQHQQRYQYNIHPASPMGTLNHAPYPPTYMHQTPPYQSAASAPQLPQLAPGASTGYHPQQPWMIDTRLPPQQGQPTPLPTPRIVEPINMQYHYMRASHSNNSTSSASASASSSSTTPSPPTPRASSSTTATTGSRGSVSPQERPTLPPIAQLDSVARGAQDDLRQRGFMMSPGGFSPHYNLNGSLSAHVTPPHRAQPPQPQPTPTTNMPHSKSLPSVAFHDYHQKHNTGAYRNSGRVGLGIYSDKQYPYPPPSNGNGTTSPQPHFQVGKDIKRRTKSGCLTCRKRRIKCDESKPTCHNCDKSRRVCLGYDPIFKASSEKKRSKHNNSSQATPEPDAEPTLDNDERGATQCQAMLPPTFSDPFQNKEHVAQHQASQEGEQRRKKMSIETLISAAHQQELQHSPKSANHNMVPTRVLDELEHGSPDFNNANWFFNTQVGPTLSRLFNTQRFERITNLKDSPSNQDCAVIECIRRLLSSIIKKPMVITDVKSQRYEELRISADYKLLRAVVLVLDRYEDPQLLPVGEGDNEVYERLVLLYQIVYGAIPDTSAANSTVAAPSESWDLNNLGTFEDCWRFYRYLTRNGTLTVQQVDFISSPRYASREQQMLVFLGLLYYGRIHPHQQELVETRVRMQLMRGCDDLFINKLCQNGLRY